MIGNDSILLKKGKNNKIIKKRFFLIKLKIPKKNTKQKRFNSRSDCKLPKKKNNKMMVILFFSFLFCYINCKVGNLCILNKVYKDDKFFSIYTHVCVNVCIYICVQNFSLFKYQYVIRLTKLKFMALSLAAYPYSTLKPLSSPRCQLLKQDLKRKIECTKKK